jgi:hypothetical protein
MSSPRFINRKLDDGTFMSIVVPIRTAERLATKCFRGRDSRRAGNFINWRNSMQVLADSHVICYLLKELNESWEKKEFGVVSFSIELPHPVGWESTDDIKHYSNEVLERFELNRRSNALRVKISRQDILAPKTNKVTIVAEFKTLKELPVLMVYSMYPGVDVGELEGDVTGREGRIFFDWDHPGVR